MRRVLPALALCCLAFAVDARTLAEIKERGAIGLCAHPNSLAFREQDGGAAGVSDRAGGARWRASSACPDRRIGS